MSMGGYLLKCALKGIVGSESEGKTIREVYVSSDGFVMATPIDESGNICHSVFLGAYEDLKKAGLL